MDTARVKSGLRNLGIEVPSWAYGNSGTRFKVFAQPGVPRDPYEKLADAAQAAMETTSVNARWQADMAPFFDLPDGRPDRGMHVLDLVFDLDAQLSAAGAAPAPNGENP